MASAVNKVKFSHQGSVDKIWVNRTIESIHLVVWRQDLSLKFIVSEETKSTAINKWEGICSVFPSHSWAVSRPAPGVSSKWSVLASSCWSSHQSPSENRNGFRRVTDINMKRCMGQLAAPFPHIQSESLRAGPTALKWILSAAQPH